MYKRLLSIFLAIFIVITAVPLEHENPVSAESEGAWILVQVIDHENSEKWAAADAHESYVVQHSYSQGSYSASTTYEGDDPYGQGRGGTLAVQASFSGVPNIIYPDKPVSLKLSFFPTTDTVKKLSFSASASADFDQWDVGPGGVTGRSISFLNDAGDYNFTIVGERSVSYDETLTAKLGKGNEGARIALRLRFYFGTPMGTNYVYEWKSDGVTSDITSETPGESNATPTPDPEDRDIIFYGITTDVTSKLMRNLKLEIAAYFDESEGQLTSGSPNFYLETASDVKGRFKVKIPLRKEKPNKVRIMIKGSLRCVLADKTSTFYFVDLDESDAKEEITFESWITVDLTDEEFEGQKEIHVGRAMSFALLEHGAWSLSDSTNNPDTFSTNMTDLELLKSYSYLYTVIWDGQYVGGVHFNQLKFLKEATLRIEMNWPPDVKPNSSHYNPKTKTIHIAKGDNLLNDYSRYILLHEYGHYFDARTNGDYTRTSFFAARAEHDEPHKGYLNSDTSDSYLEGFATAFVAISQHVRKESMPHLAGPHDLGTPGNYVAWRNNGTDEELAVAIFLYKMYLQTNAPMKYWEIIDPDRDNLLQYYNAFEKELSGSKKKTEELWDLMLKGGLYKMPFGNGKYDLGEPFRDSNKNEQYDSGEFFTDLMFDTDSDGRINEDKIIKSDKDDTLILGESSDALRERKTTYKLNNSFIYLSGQLPQNILIHIIPDKEPAYKMLAPVEMSYIGGKVYIGLISRPLKGKIELSIPGGAVIYAGDIEQLQEKKKDTFGQDLPLAEVLIIANDHPLSTVKSAPTGGDPKSSGTLEIPKLTNVVKMNKEAATLAREANPEELLENFVLGEESGKITGGFINNAGIIIAVVVILTLLLGLGLVILIILLRKKSPAKSLCTQCNHPIKPGDLFCTSCGRKVNT